MQLFIQEILSKPRTTTLQPCFMIELNYEEVEIYPAQHGNWSS